MIDMKYFISILIIAMYVIYNNGYQYAVQSLVKINTDESKPAIYDANRCQALSKSHPALSRQLHSLKKNKGVSLSWPCQWIEPPFNKLLQSILVGIRSCQTGIVQWLYGYTGYLNFVGLKQTHAAGCKRTVPKIPLLKWCVLNPPGERWRDARTYQGIQAQLCYDDESLLGFASSIFGKSSELIFSQIYSGLPKKSGETKIPSVNIHTFHIITQKFTTKSKPVDGTTPALHHLGCLEPSTLMNGINIPTSTDWFAWFLNHQQYDQQSNQRATNWKKHIYIYIYICAGSDLSNHGYIVCCEEAMYSGKTW